MNDILKQKIQGGAAGVALALGLLVGPSTGFAEEVVFAHSSYEDFAAGTLGNAGQNLFVSHDGTLGFINWFDLNADGYPDLVINNDHNPYENVDGMIYYNRGGRGLRSLLPAIPEDTPAFQQLLWQQESLETIDFLPALGGGKSLAVDLNGDGYLELIFANFIHGWAMDHFPVFIYWGDADGYRAARRSELPSLAARGVAAADLNGDGRLDLVLANYGMEYHASETFAGDQYESWIYWQDDLGFSADHRTSLPTEYALDVQVADLNGDGQSEIIVLNSGPRPAVRIFTPGENGYDPQAFVDLPVLNPRFARGLVNQVLVADFDGDARLDLFVTSAGTKSQIFWNRSEGFSAEYCSELETLGALAATAADLNGDGRLDLVIANNHRELETGRDYEVPSYIYWGHEAGYSAERRTELPTLGAAGVAVGDVTGDGVLDIVFANHRDNARYDVPSYIYTGSEQGYHRADRQDLHAFGPVDVLLADLTGNGRLDVFFMNRNSGTPNGAADVPSYVYWGNEAGSYSVAAMSRLPLNSAYSSNAGDLDGDGHADLVFTTNKEVTILYGRDGAYPADARAAYPMPFRGMTSNLADFNRDGRLDILVAGLPAENSLAVLYGQAEGFSEPIFFDAGLGVIASAVGDLDGDGQMEIVLGGRGDVRVILLTPEGMPDPERGYWLRVDRQSQRLTLADLDGNGYLDLVASHHRDNITKRLTTPSAIYWNRHGQLTAEDRTELPSYGGHWVSVADVYGSGELDVLLSNYHGERRRDVDLFIYRPDAEGHYGQRRETVPAASSSANLVMDFTGDGRNDLLVVNHTGPNVYVGLSPKSGVHGFGSYLYEGSAEGFSVGRRSVLPSFGPHKIINAEPGDIARRRDYETYTSAPVAAELEAGSYVIEVAGRYNFRTEVEVLVRTGDDQSWTPAPLAEADGQRKRFVVQLDAPVTSLQYEFRLHTGGSGTGPLIESVRMLRH